MRAHDPLEIVPLSATALLVRAGDEIDRQLTLRLTRLVRYLDERALPGLVDLVPAYTTLLVGFDPARISPTELSRHLHDGWNATADSENMHYPNAREIEIPVVYGGEAGPDLDDVARHTGLTPEDVVDRHSSAGYTVGALGFSPGFAFLIGLPPELATPRRASPRARVPAGSVGIAGPQTGVYSLPTPGGWSLIGRTPRRMFDPEGSGEDELRPGDAVRFVPVTAAGAPPFTDADVIDSKQPDVALEGPIEIVAPGLQASVQDRGRVGQGRVGITPGGALDRAALIAGNRLLGNDDGAAAIEWTLLPPTIRFHEACRIALTGADPGWRLNDLPVRIGKVTAAGEGDVLGVRHGGAVCGARGYIGVAGGIDVPEVRGSRALDLSAGFGGGYGRPLRSGDRLPVGPAPDHPNSDNVLIQDRRADPSWRPFRVVRGPQADRFSEQAWQTFVSGSFTVDAQSNRMGLRLNGPAIEPEGGADIVSEGVATGAVQVTSAGQPIVLLPGRATIGGYTKIATVIEADHDRLGQLPPGATVRFAVVTLEEASAALQRWRPSAHGGLSADMEEPTMSTDPNDLDPTNAWTPDGVIRVIREIASHDVRGFSLRVESAGLEVTIDRGGYVPAPPSSGQPVDSQADSRNPEYPHRQDSHVITAPLLGVFYRRPSPNDANFVEDGVRVERGQTVGLIEVMKSFHEVTAPEAGVVTRVLVEDGASVEYGQALMAFEPVSGE